MARRWLPTGGKFLRCFLIGLDAYCVPEAGINYKRHKNFTPNSCGFAGDEIKRGASLRSRFGFSLAMSGLSLALLAFRDFLAVHRYVTGRLDADAHLRTVHRHHGHFHIIANAQGLTGATSKYQHLRLPLT